ncbi:hypothetical protein WDK46_20810 [Escherichia coli]|uniref:hypothetical protein n=1 Tax=Escherichia coli TaxID=562 RepID=UPI0002CC4A79|nr:hypothetical protein [Escherichia coli]EHW1673894.1 hypothetical protein [Salmonella enterica]HCM3056821.1 hypothetical protein [Salmonella enterica subsp. enterica serovar Hato]HCM4427689.1 hypothetical protein [Salmonella enterica subsp. enterica serovar Agama]EFT2987793.1 hypothetical protein [Escherichia coli]EHM0438758.1 hypothetical protein [Escherichia coli]
MSKDPKEGVEYITGADGVKRPMAYYKAAEERARMENTPKCGSFFDMLNLQQCKL